MKKNDKKYLILFTHETCLIIQAYSFQNLIKTCPLGRVSILSSIGEPLLVNEFLFCFPITGRLWSPTTSYLLIEFGWENKMSGKE